MEFNQVAIHTAEGSADMINRVMTKDNIGLAALLETKEAIWENGVPPEHQRQPILVATCHVHWDPEFCDVKLIQTMMLMNELKNIIEETQTSLRPGSTAPDSNSIPLILCGDLNSLPESGTLPLWHQLPLSLTKSIIFAHRCGGVLDHRPCGCQSPGLQGHRL